MQPIVLPPKFTPFTLDQKSKGENKVLFDRLQLIFNGLVIDKDQPLAAARGFRSLDGKPHIVEHDGLSGWIIKAERTELGESTRFDTHIYRVRRAEKLRRLNPKEFVIPRKYVYQHEGRCYVVAEKLKFDSNQTLKKLTYDNATTVTLTAAQAEEGARLIFHGKLEDVGAHNIAVTVDGKLAIYDTEPLLRASNKQRVITRFLPLLAKGERLIIAQHQSASLHDLTDGKEAGGKIRTIENTMLIKYLAQVVALIAVPIIVAVGLSHYSFVRSIVMTAKIFAGINAAHGIILMLRVTYNHFRERTMMARFERGLQ